MSKQISLNGYSKADLIWIINYISKFNNDMYLQRALSELKLKKEQDRIIEAEKYSALANQKRLEYIELLTPYDGKPWREIPLAAMNKITKLMKEAQSADEKYMRLMFEKE